MSACAIVGLGVAIARSARSADSNCDAFEVEYALEANLLLTDTPLGEGNGLHRIGPGKAVVRYERGGRVTVRSCEMRMRFTMHAKTLVWKTTIVTDAMAKWSPDACGVVADGRREGNQVVWTGDARGFRTDGTLDCSGAFCGKFGAPPVGKSELHMTPTPKQLRAFEITPDLGTIKMPYTRIAKTESPQQTSIVAMFGREVRRTCVKPTQCP
ncbi:MAG: hypothetical protein ACXVEE_13095 [Polyangiales bacterium]